MEGNKTLVKIVSFSNESITDGVPCNDKCPRCNWEASTLYILEGESKELGSCPQCMIDAFIDEGYEIQYQLKKK